MSERGGGGGGGPPYPPGEAARHWPRPGREAPAQDPASGAAPGGPPPGGQPPGPPSGQPPQGPPASGQPPQGPQPPRPFQHAPPHLQPPRPFGHAAQPPQPYGPPPGPPSQQPSPFPHQPPPYAPAPGQAPPAQVFQPPHGPGPGQPPHPQQPPFQAHSQQPFQQPPSPQPPYQAQPPYQPQPFPPGHGQPFQPPASFPPAQPQPFQPLPHLSPAQGGGQQAPYQPPFAGVGPGPSAPPDPQAGSTMLGWQASPDPAWAQNHSSPSAPLGPASADDSAPLRAPNTAAASFALALRRAFRLYIDAREVTDAERAALEATSPPITDPDVQGFLSWRRSVHLVVAVAIVPLLLFQIIGLADSKDSPSAWRALQVLQLLVDASFALLLWTQLRNWTNWHRQRRVLAIGWLAFFLMPFVFYLYPLRSAMDEVLAQQAGTDPRVAQAFSGLFGMIASVVAMIQLAPKAISLMPGLLRGALTSKLLFPGSSGPGWLMLLLAPIYALFMYVVLIIPYQITGSGYFVPAMIGLIGAQIWLGRMAFQLARPERLEEALALVRKVRTTYFVLNLIGLVFVVIGLSQLLKQLHIPFWSGVQVLFSLLVNVLLLTLIATDQIVANLVRGQKLLTMPGSGDAQAEFARDIAHFDDPRL
ncbi:MAG TPA: hypothetical protein VK698_27445 [Kofleriaceae bacterium]|nr:hypothetical protein [Kofleriaceae bacterium]